MVRKGKATQKGCNLKERRNDFSDWDIRKINTLYNCPEDKYQRVENAENNKYTVLPRLERPTE